MATDGRSNDILLWILESNRKNAESKFHWNVTSIVSPDYLDSSIEDVVRTLREDGFVVIPHRLKTEVIRNLYELASSCRLDTERFCAFPKSNTRN